MNALVTGASSGIGYQMALYLSKLGYDIIAVARDEEAMLKLKKECKTVVEVIPMDLGSVDNCHKLYDMTKDKNIDILINNAGFGLFGKFSDIELEKELAMININIIAMHILTKLFLSDMKTRNSGHILNTASIAGFMPGPLMAAYYASKSYVVKLSEAIAKELEKDKSNVKISVLCPGPVSTNFNKVAGVNFGISSLTSTYVAKYGIDKMLKNKLVIIPGFTIKCARFFSRFASDKFVSEIAYHIQTKKK